MTESQQQAPAPAQTRILADWMLTQADAGLVRDAELVLGADGRIAYAGPRRGEAAPGDLVLDGQLLMPGLVNGHTHSAMTLFRGVSDDEGLAPWLDAVRARELRMTAADIATGLRLAMVEMLRSGTTAFADMYHWDEELLRIVQDAGMRVLAAPALFAPDAVGFPAADERDGAAMLDETERLAERFAGDEQIRLAYGPHAPYTCPPEFLREIGERAVRTGLPVHIHLSESAPEVQVNLDRYGRTPAMHIAELGMLDARVLVAHGVHLTQEEIELLAAGGAAISHNPVSNLKLGSGIAPLPEMLASGVALALGTDSVASNNSLDLFEELKTGAILHRGARQSADAVLGSDLLDLATARGAAAIGFPEAGALEAGRFGDVISVDLSGAHAVPLHSVTSFLGFAARGSDVRNVFVGGRHLLADGELTTLDEAAILSDAAAVTERIHSELEQTDLGAGGGPG